MTRPRVIVIGAGAGGMMAAGRAAERGAHVLLLEKMPVSGKKILISGKTRCNVTNARPLDEFIPMYGPNGRFLHGAFHRFFRDDLLALLRRYGVATKTERGGRVFPVSDDAADVVRALEHYMNDGGVEVQRARATAIETSGGKVAGVKTERGSFEAEAAILATGGASYPETGSTGDGFRIARALGHTIVKLRPALVPLVVHESKLAGDMQGVSLRNVRLTAYACPAADINRAQRPTEDCGRGTARPRPRKPVIESRMGEMMMTHFGIGGPIVLLMSLAVVDSLEKGPVTAVIDLKPALSEEKLDRRIQRDLAEQGRRGFRHILAGLLPRKLIDPYLALTGIPADKRANQIGADERKRLVDRLKSLRFTIRGPRSMDCAIVTAGGVSLKEIDPRTMASRLVTGLYCCGEVMDLDADTGGYNLQAAFSTGYVAGDEAAF
jgi:predicted flavoprotein YhiN